MLTLKRQDTFTLAHRQGPARQFPSPARSHTTVLADMAVHCCLAPPDPQPDRVSCQSCLFHVPQSVDNIAQHPLGISFSHINQHPSIIGGVALTVRTRDKQSLHQTQGGSVQFLVLEGVGNPQM